LGESFADDLQQTLLGPVLMKPERLEIARLKRKAIKKAERDLLKGAAA
jgi:hypothetical protein